MEIPIEYRKEDTPNTSAKKRFEPFQGVPRSLKDDAIKDPVSESSPTIGRQIVSLYAILEK